MLILSIRTDQPEAEAGLFENQKAIEIIKWQAHRRLAETIHATIESLLSGHSKSLKDLEGIVCYSGPGSFTGLRISMSVANALSYSLGIPIVSHNQNWPAAAIERLLGGVNDKIGQVEYGSEPYVSSPKK